MIGSFLRDSVREQKYELLSDAIVKKILIVEDVGLNVDLLVQLLEDEYSLIVAEDGAKGLEFAQLYKPDLILLDMSLPVIDGWEVAQKVKSNDAIRHIPIIGLSAHAMSGDGKKAIKAGCDEYLTKPLNDELLFEKLEFFLGCT